VSFRTEEAQYGLVHVEKVRSFVRCGWDVTILIPQPARPQPLPWTCCLIGPASCCEKHSSICQNWERLKKIEMSRRGRVKRNELAIVPKDRRHRPESSLAKTGGSFLSSKSPQVTRQGILSYSPGKSRDAQTAVLAPKRTICPATSFNSVCCTRRMSPGRMLGSIRFRYRIKEQ